MISHKLETFKRDLICNLELTSDEALSLEKRFYSVKRVDASRGWRLRSFCLGIFFVCILIPVKSLSLLAVTLILYLIYQVYFCLTYDRRRAAATREYELKLAEQLAHCVSTWLDRNYFERLKINLLNMNFKSLRELKCSFTHRVHFESLGKTFEKGLILENYDGLSSNISHRFASVQPVFYELTPEISFSVDQLFVSMKCDFRVVRSEFDLSEVASIFRTTIDTVPYLDSSYVKIRQWSSTKNFIWGQNDLGKEVLLLLENKRRKPKQSRKTFKTASSNERYEISVDRSSQNRFAPKITLAPKSRLVTLFKTNKVEKLLDSLQKKVRSEITAMAIAKEYEFHNGRTPKDVSAQNLGYDLESSATNDEKLKIEVKGLDTTGDVLLTANEIRAAEEHGDQYFVYIVDYCSGESEQKLYRLKGINRADLKERIVNYGFSLAQQNCQNVIEVTIE